MGTVLLTGFEPYGDWPSNPAGTVAEQLNESVIAGATVVGRTLPVTLDGLGPRVRGLLEEVDPVAVLSLGLYPGAATLRVERLGLNVADFSRPDNDGLLAANLTLIDNQPMARLATIPVHAVRDAQLAAGLPSIVSNSAGTYLCNAMLYQFLNQTAHRANQCPCGFMHLPFEPAQVAASLHGSGDAASGAGPLQDCVPSMHLDTMLAGTEIALKTILESIDQSSDRTA
ncbi:MAG: peptidase [Chromatiales bacterium]|nr:peptidase [Chromatiales bacterium]